MMDIAHKPNVILFSQGKDAEIPEALRGRDGAEAVTVHVWDPQAGANIPLQKMGVDELKGQSKVFDALFAKRKLRVFIIALLIPFVLIIFTPPAFLSWISSASTASSALAFTVFITVILVSFVYGVAGLIIRALQRLSGRIEARR